MIVENLNENERLPASVGVICVSEGDVDGPASVILQPRVKQQINNIIQQFIRIENNQIVNLQQIFNIKQQITQNAIQIAIGGGNVTQIINQSASQIVAANGTNIGQIINQTANQVAIQGGVPPANVTGVPPANVTGVPPANVTGVPPANVTGVPPDTTVPVITNIPEDMVVEATSPLGAQVTYPIVTAQDDVDGPVDVDCQPPSGSIFEIGDTEVTCSATDAAGNTSTESFTITVEPEESEEQTGNNTDT
jgi:hypothetical protein